MGEGYKPPLNKPRVLIYLDHRLRVCSGNRGFHLRHHICNALLVQNSNDMIPEGAGPWRRTKTAISRMNSG